MSDTFSGCTALPSDVIRLERAIHESVNPFVDFARDSSLPIKRFRWKDNICYLSDDLFDDLAGRNPFTDPKDN